MIRDARVQDAAAIAAIWNPVIRETAITFNSIEKSPEEIAALIAAREAEGLGFFVAEEGGGAISGFATYFQFRGGVGYARSMEHTVILAPQARGHGLGRRLMAHLEAHAAARGAHSIFAGVSSGNPAGRAFHARLGYEEVAVLREVGFKFGRWFDLHLMQKFLTPP
ncbi:MAG: N-acetyltransferase family protein [Alphaproteobacteria bacterium]|nr:MAG: N-acetyltransferase family protein [Alphaproteobacteria bacterium]